MGFERADVQLAFPVIACSDRYGFRFPPESRFKGDCVERRLEFESRDGATASASRRVANVSLSESLCENDFRPSIDLPVRSGYPFEITKLLRKYRPGTY